MKRDQSLVPLSREHHFALRVARQLKACASGDARWLADHWEEIRTALKSYWLHGLEPHFAAEEQELPWSLLDPHWRVRLTGDHDDLRAVLARITESEAPTSADLLLSLAAGLDTHVRWEEKSLFPALQEADSAGIALRHEELELDPRWSLPQPSAGRQRRREQQ